MGCCLSGSLEKHEDIDDDDETRESGVGNMSSNQIMSGFLGPLENIFPKFGHLLFEPVVLPSKWLFD